MKLKNKKQDDEDDIFNFLVESEGVKRCNILKNININNEKLKKS